MSKLFIGMPVWNSERFLEKSIDSIRTQSFTDWEMLISDNCSSDKTEEISKSYCEKDSRITYIKQEKNIGGEKNFKFLLDQAKTPYFMWASDDLWDKDFIKICLSKLEADPEIGLSFCNIVNIDPYDRIIREYPSFEKFESKNKYDRIITYLVDSEKLGKANLLYSIFRTLECRAAWNRAPFDSVWGSEMGFVLSAIAYSGVAIEKRVLFKKRIITEYSDFRKIEVNNPNERLFPLAHADEYIAKMLSGLANTEYYQVSSKIMELRRELVEAQTNLRKMNRLLSFIKKPHRVPQRIYNAIKTFIKKKK